ncbi:hypothetical protein H4R18_005967 [Coemansia javaensis]|uniref:YjgF-like protein n=1 Tax=Coemansia javaensis TaxID=2761396 RepID=A0A9W8LCL2_9FUNG|nr:hypothetical protein H4R18_005972 [Coemansia javaensis]KAJ2775642.1 hypothetical protein H4R18_005967 [Coemansia javaensis]
MDLSARTRIASGGPYEDAVGYSRVVAVGPFVYVAGTTASSDGSEIPDSAADQTRQTIEIMERKLHDAGSGLDEVVRVRMFVTDIKGDWLAISEVVNSFFSAIRPVMTMVQVDALIDDRMKIEIEMDAVRKSAGAA